MSDDQLKQFRTRWRRWLGNKTAVGRPYWATLLSSRWSGWCEMVGENHQIEFEKLPWNREDVKRIYRARIDVATMRELLKLDGIYATERAGL